MRLTIEALDAWWPPTLTPEPVLAHTVRVMHDRGGEPEHAPLDRAERGDIADGSLGERSHQLEVLLLRHYDLRADRAPVLEAGPRACPPDVGSGQADPRRTDGFA
jgi:hypothetical protein